MRKQGISICALCKKVIKNYHQTNIPILYDICSQCQTNLQTGEPIINQGYLVKPLQKKI